jgi:flagellar hook-length control protein FliK
MNVLPSSAAPVAATNTSATSQRSDASVGADAGAFGEVLGQHLQRKAQGETSTAAARTSPRKAHDPASKETQEANALPLIAAAIESRSLARPAAASDGSNASATTAGLSQALAPGAQLATDPAAAPGLARAGQAQADAAKPPSLQDGDDAARPLAGAAASDAHTDGAALLVTQPALASAPAAAPTNTTIAAAAARSDAQDASPVQDAASDGTPRIAAATGGDAVQRGAEADHETPRASAHDQPATVSTDPVATPTAPAPAPVAAAAPPAAATAAPAQGSVAPTVASAAWGPALGQEVARLHQAGHGQAQLELNPPGLGPLSVSLSVADQQAHAVFVSPHPEVRAAVEAALPQLRSALADNGISLGQASVGAEHQSGSGAFSQSAQDQAPQRRWAEAAFAAPERSAPLSVASRRGGGHMLDTFA